MGPRIRKGVSLCAGAVCAGASVVLTSRAVEPLPDGTLPATGTGTALTLIVAGVAGFYLSGGLLSLVFGPAKGT